MNANRQLINSNFRSHIYFSLNRQILIGKIFVGLLVGTMLGLLCVGYYYFGLSNRCDDLESFVLGNAIMLALGFIFCQKECMQRFVPFFLFFWTIYGIVSLSSSTDYCKTTHIYKVSLAYVIMYCFCVFLAILGTILLYLPNSYLLRLIQYLEQEATGSGVGLLDTCIDRIHEIDARELDDDNLTCSICFCELNNDVVIKKLSCGHVFDETCIKSWLLIKNECPLCRKPHIVTEI